MQPGPWQNMVHVLIAAAVQDGSAGLQSRGLHQAGAALRTTATGAPLLLH